jgi:hypothetical protein
MLFHSARFRSTPPIHGRLLGTVLGTFGPLSGINRVREFPRNSLRSEGWGWLRGLDLNQRPLGYEPNELPDCSTPRFDYTHCIRA